MFINVSIYLADMKLTIVVPVFNEAENLPLLQSRLLKALKTLPYQVEIIYVNDGSTDNSGLILARLQDRNTRIITFRRNFGQTAALQAGFSEASGDIIITLDADLQNDPDDIPLLLRKLSQGYDVVSGWRYPRKDPFLTKRLPSLLSNWLVKMISGVKVHDQGCTLKAYRRECVKDLELYGEMHRFIPLVLQLEGYKIGEARVAHHPRRFGKSKYNIKRLFKGFLDVIFIKFWFNYSNRPLHFFGLMGLGSILIGVLIGVLNLAYHLFIIQRTSLSVGPLLLLAVLLIMLGLQLIVMGFLGEIMIRVYYKDKKKRCEVK